MNDNALLVLTTLPDQASATHLAEQLVSARLAACVNILTPCTSIYHWQGKIESTQEVPLLIKTTTACYAALEQAILAEHPYELPEIVQVALSGGLPAYLEWLTRETSS